MIKSVTSPKVMAMTFGTIYFVFAGIPFITLKWIEAWSWYTIILDFPLFLVGKYLFSDLMYSNALATAYCFIIAGTIMYASIGYLFGGIVQWAVKKIEK